MNIGFIGYSASKFDSDKAYKIIRNIFKNKIDPLDKDIKIVSGATNLGIPKIVYEIADKKNYYTIGIMCSKGFNYEMFDVNKLYVEGNEWGEESELFLDTIDILFKVGGGEQSKKELNKAKKRGIKTFEYDL
jgi:hypothetical protein